MPFIAFYSNKGTKKRRKNSRGDDTGTISEPASKRRREKSKSHYGHRHGLVKKKGRDMGSKESPKTYLDKRDGTKTLRKYAWGIK